MVGQLVESAADAGSCDLVVGDVVDPSILDVVVGVVVCSVVNVSGVDLGNGSQVKESEGLSALIGVVGHLIQVVSNSGSSDLVLGDVVDPTIFDVVIVVVVSGVVDVGGVDGCDSSQVLHI